MEDWKEYRLDELYVFGNGLSKGSKYFGYGHPFVSFKTVFNNYFLSEELSDYVDSDEKEQTKCSVQKSDVLLTRTSETVNELGYSCVALRDYPKATFNGFCKRMRPITEGIIHDLYAGYYFRSSHFRNQVCSMSNMVTRASLSNEMLGRLTIKLPSYKTQTQIGELLFSIDRKIALNRQINDNLELQAQAAFNNIVAKYSDCETINLSEIAALNPKRTISKGTIARSIEMAQLPTSGSFPAGWDMKEYNGGMKFQNGDTLMARITPCLENGKVAYINFLEENEVAFGSTEYIVIASKGAIAPEFFYFLTRHNEFVDFAVKNMNGSSGRQRVSAETIGTYELPVISQEDMVILETIAKEALNKIKYNSLENIRLSEIRDTLLPKLMSGEFKINEIDC